MLSLIQVLVFPKHSLTSQVVQAKFTWCEIYAPENKMSSLRALNRHHSRVTVHAKTLDIARN